MNLIEVTELGPILFGLIIHPVIGWFKKEVKVDAERQQ